MFDSPLDFFSLLIAIVALIVARKAFNQVGDPARAAGADRGRIGGRAKADGGPDAAAARHLCKNLNRRWQPLRPASQPNSPRHRAEPVTPAADATASGATAMPPPLPPPPGRSRLRGAHRHPLGGLDRRADARARRLLPGALFDRSGPARTRRPHHPRRPVRAGAARRRRVDAAHAKAPPTSRCCRSPTSRRS